MVGSLCAWEWRRDNCQVGIVGNLWRAETRSTLKGRSECGSSACTKGRWKMTGWNCYGSKFENFVQFETRLSMFGKVAHRGLAAQLGLA
jgi:hypothetical protein